jgi:hypothetical protein
MTTPHNEVTWKMAEEAIPGVVFEPVRFMACIPIIPPDQEDEAPADEQRGERANDANGVGEHYFEKRIRRVGGPPRPPKPKYLFSSEPAAPTVNSSDEWVHRAIGIAGQRR